MANFINNLKNLFVNGIKIENNTADIKKQNDINSNFLFEFVEEEEQSELDILLNGVNKKSNVKIENTSPNSKKITGMNEKGEITYTIEDNSKGLTYPCVTSWSDNEAFITFNSKSADFLTISQNENATINADGTVIVNKNGLITKYNNNGNVL